MSNSCFLAGLAEWQPESDRQGSKFIPDLSSWPFDFVSAATIQLPVRNREPTVGGQPGRFLYLLLRCTLPQRLR